MNKKKDLSLVNCLATSMLAYFLTIPLHELFHALTDLAYGNGVACFSAGGVNPIEIVAYETLSPFHRIMLAGGSASILNVIIGAVLLIVLLKTQMGPMTRVFLVQLMGGHLSEGIGYFLIGGLFCAGDWGLVFSHLTELPGLVTGLRIGLAALGAVGIVGTFFALNYMSYYFIEDADNRKERLGVAFRLHLLMVIVGYAVGMTITLLSPMNATGELSPLLGFLYNMVWITFFWGFMFTGVMKVLPPKKSRFLYKLPAEPRVPLWIAAVLVIGFDIFVLGPGLFFG